MRRSWWLGSMLMLLGVPASAGDEDAWIGLARAWIDEVISPQLDACLKQTSPRVRADGRPMP